jgi:phosphoribosylpyrophosphate synthetase
MMVRQRKSFGKPPEMQLVGDVRDQNCFILDDIIDSGVKIIDRLIKYLNYLISIIKIFII